MKTIIYSGYSDNNAELAKLTQPNKEQYAQRHGYEVVTDKCEWERFKLEGLKRTRELLEKADNVLAVGSDVLFMNHRLTVESLVSDDRAVLSKETISQWPINNDVLLWQNNATCRKLLDRIIADARIWLRYPWLWQAHLWDLMQLEPEIAASVRLAEPRELQSTHQQGQSKWQLGDRIIHLLNYGQENKIMLSRMYLPYAGEPTYRTHCEVPFENRSRIMESFNSEENESFFPLHTQVQVVEHDGIELLAMLP